jgi:hypothetical protein
MAARQDRPAPSLPSPPAPSAPAHHGRGFSFGGKSDKSHRSDASGGNKHSYQESHEEKVRRSLQTKADPTLAMSEAQPGMLWLGLSVCFCILTDPHSRRGFGKVESRVAARNPVQGPVWKCYQYDRLFITPVISMRR